MSAVTEYRIEATPRPDLGPDGGTERTAHWSHMREPGEHLREEIDSMAAALRLSRGEMSTDNPADVEWLHDAGLNPERLDIDDNAELAHEALDGWALSASFAQEERAHTYEAREDIGRALFILGTGGPHVELDVLTRQGGVESVTLQRHWTQSDRATTTDSRACEIAAEFLALVNPLNL